MEAIMQRAGEAVAGIPIGTEAVSTLWPDRFIDVKGAAMFAQIVGMVRDGCTPSP